MTQMQSLFPITYKIVKGYQLFPFQFIMLFVVIFLININYRVKIIGYNRTG